MIHLLALLLAPVARAQDPAPAIPPADGPLPAEAPAPASLAPVFDLAPAEGRIARVEVLGLRRVEEAALLQGTRLQTGDTLTPDALARDLRTIWATGFVSELSAETAPAAPGSVVLRFSVKEKPAVREVKLEGNKKVKKEDLDPLLDIEPFTVPSEARVKANLQALRKTYLEKGYYLVEIEPVFASAGADLVDLTWKITENRKVLVKEVEITGNAMVPDRTLRRVMQTRAAGMLPWLSSGGTFVEENLEADTYAMRSMLLEQGHVDATVGKPQVYLTPDKRFIHVSIPVEEGPRYRIGSVKVQGDFVPEEGLTAGAVESVLNGNAVRDVQSAFETDKEAGVLITHGWVPDIQRGAFDFGGEGAPIRRGDWFRLTTLQAAMGRVSDLYGDQGYAFANANPLPRSNPETGMVDIVVQIERGDKMRLGRIEITGNDPTFDKVVRREIPIDEGEIYRGRALREARARLERLGFFEKVDISTPRGEGENVLDMKVDVSERPTGSFSVGAGYGSADSFLFTANVQKSNFLGLGYVMSLAGNLSARTKTGNLSFYDPYFLDTRWTLRVDGFYNQRSYIENEYQRGGTLQVGRYLDQRNDIRLAVDYTLQDVGLLSLDEYKERLYGGQLYRNGLTSSVGLTFELDKRNNRIQATRGLRFSLSTELAGGWRLDDDRVLNVLGGDFRFWQTQGNLRFYRPLVRKNEVDWLVFRWNTSMGHIQSTDGTIVPFIHRYRAGGILSIRGYDPFSLGPSIRASGFRDYNVPRSQFVGTEDPTAADDRLVIGGTETWVNNIELESPVLRAAGLSLVTFFDAGNTFGDTWGQGFFDPTGLRLSVGAGVRWQSPIGPLRFEWGTPIQRNPDERRSVFDFTIGSAF